MTTLDKRPADCRVACPTLAVQEIERDLNKYFEPVARCDSEEAEKVVQDWETEFGRLLEHEDIDGAVLEETDFQTVRALPKGKSPGTKSRLVVGCHRLATAKIHKWATRGVEAVLDMCRKNGQAAAECNVSSVGQVNEALRELVNTLFAQNGGTVLSMGKFDFTNFFMEVNRECVMQSLGFWVKRVVAASGRRKLLRVKKTQEWKRSRCPTGRWEARGVRLVARGDVASDEVVFAAKSLKVVLAADLGNLLRSTGSVWRQLKGLTIGSCWGGTGCRVWCAYREEQAAPVLAWARRRDFEWWEMTHGLTTPPANQLAWGKIRWVDDRWIVMRGLTVRGVFCARLAEFLSYANAGPWATLAVASGLTASVCDKTTSGSWSLNSMLEAAQLIFDFVRMDHMRQTVEDPGAVVGFDVTLVRDSQLVQPSELVRCGRNSELCLALRMSTKDQVAFTAPEVPGNQELVNPRLPDRRVDCRPMVRRVDGLVQWAVRLADCHQVMCVGGNDTVGGVWSTSKSELQQWLIAPWLWFALELSRAGWRENEWDKALFRAWIAAAGGCSTNPARAHRRWVLEGAYRLAYLWQRPRGTGAPDFRRA